MGCWLRGLSVDQEVMVQPWRIQDWGSCGGLRSLKQRYIEEPPTVYTSCFLAGHPLPLGLHDSARPVLPRPPISNPPPLISSAKHPGVLERQLGTISQVSTSWAGSPLHGSLSEPWDVARGGAGWTQPCCCGLRVSQAVCSSALGR